MLSAYLTRIHSKYRQRVCLRTERSHQGDANEWVKTERISDGETAAVPEFRQN